jgi:hypothetical protein
VIITRLKNKNSNNYKINNKIKNKNSNNYKINNKNIIKIINMDSDNKTKHKPFKIAIMARCDKNINTTINN